MSGIINKEETLEFREYGGQFRVYMLPNHPLYEFREDDSLRGGIIRSPSNIDYDCWVSENLVVDGEIRDGSVVIAQYKVNNVHTNSLNYIGPGVVVKGSDIRGSFIRIAGESYLEGVKTIHRNAHQDGATLEIINSKITGSLDIWASLSRFDKLSIHKSEIHGSSVIKINHAENTFILDSVLVGDVNVGMDVKIIDSCFVMNGFNFIEEDNRNIIV